MESLDLRKGVGSKWLDRGRGANKGKVKVSVVN